MTRAALAILLLACLPAVARDQGQWSGVDPATRQWFRGLTNQQGQVCCDTSDGSRVEDPDWRVEGDGYAVLIAGKWQPVPPELVVRGTNRIGFAIAWTWPPTSPSLRCFMPGTAG